MNNKNSNVASTNKSNKFLLPITVLFVLLFVTTLTSYFIFSSIEKNSKEIFETANDNLLSLIEDRLDDYFSLLFSERGLYVASNFVDRSEFQTFINSQEILERFPGLQALEFIEYVRGENIDNFIETVVNDASLINEGYPDFSIMPEGQRDEYYVVNYVEPFVGNEAAFGFDLFSNPARREAIEESRDANNIVITSPIALVQDEANEPAFLAFLPIYENGLPIDTLEQRREAIKGFALAVFKVRDLFDGIVGKSSVVTKNIHYRIEDPSAPNDLRLLLDSQVYSNVDYSDHKRKYVVTTTVEVGGRSWEIISSETPNFTDNIKSKNTPLIIFIAGILLSAAMSYIIFVVVNSRQKAVSLANTMTRDLKTAREEAENALKVEKSNKQKIEQALKDAENEKHRAEEKTAEAERLNKSMVGRELRMAELKKEIKELKKKQGQF